MAVDRIIAALDAANEKLSQLLAERSKIEKEIVEWKRVVDSLSAVIESENTDPSDVEISALANETGRQTIKFTDGVRLVLKQNSGRPVPISVPKIREQLINLGFDFSKYAQPLVPIHNTLRRLVEQGEVTAVSGAEGQTVGYEWISPIERALGEDNSYYMATGEGINQTIEMIDTVLAQQTQLGKARRRAQNLARMRRLKKEE